MIPIGNWCRAVPALAMGLCLGLAAGCASERGATTRDAIRAAMDEAVQPPAQVAAPFAVAPKPVAPAPVEERFDVNVMNADARDFFMGLVAGTSRNLIVHPDVAGTVTLTLKQVTLPEVLDTVRDVYGYDYRRTGGTYIVLPATLSYGRRRFPRQPLDVRFAPTIPLDGTADATAVASRIEAAFRDLWRA